MGKFLSIKYKLIAILTLSTLLTLIGYFFLASSLFEEDKLAYLYSNVLIDSQTFEKNMAEKVSSKEEYINLLLKVAKNQGDVLNLDSNVIALNSKNKIFGEKLDLQTGGKVFDVKNQILKFSTEAFKAKVKFSLPYNDDFSNFNEQKNNPRIYDTSKSVNKEKIGHQKIYDEIIKKKLLNGIKEIEVGDSLYLVSFIKVFDNIYYLNFVNKNYALSTIDVLRKQSFFFLLILISISSIVSIFIANNISSPLISLAKYSQEFGEGDMSVRSKVKANNEIGLLSDSFNEMAAKIEKLVAEVKTYSNHLEELVAKRTKSLKKAVNIQKAMMESLGQGFFMISKNLKIMDVYSQSAKDFFGEELKGLDSFNVLSKGETPAAMNEQILKNMFAEVMPFQDIANLAPKDFVSEKERNIALEYKPVRNKKDEISGIVVISTDKTEELLANKKAEREQNKVKMILRLVGGKQQFLKLLTKTQEMLDRLAFLGLEIEKDSNQKEIFYNEIFRIVHTIKGNFSSYYLDSLTSTLHDWETGVKEMDPQDLSNELLGKISSDVDNEITNFITEYGKLIGVNSWKSDNSQLEISHQDFFEIMDSSKEFSDREEFVGFLKRRMFQKNISKLLEPLNFEMSSHANKVGKKVNEIKLVGEDILIDSEKFNEFSIYLIHMLRNSIDHGIESADKRLGEGKDESGTISLSLSMLGENSVEILYSDDGKGIDPEALKEIAKQRGLELTPELESNPLNIIFESGFSTAEELSETSGRGVGMDAVRDYITKQSGSIEISSEVGKGTQFQIKLAL